MPDLLRDEETENRTHSLCLFNVSGTTRNNRCKNCPGLARTRALYQQRRCPLDIFSPDGAAGEGKSETIDPKSDPKLLATSSKLQHGPDAVGKISDTTAGISLNGAARKFVRHPRSDPGCTCNPSTDMSVSVPHLDTRVKRKADHEPESSSMRNESADVYIAHNTASQDQMEGVQNALSNRLGVVSPRGESSNIDAGRMQQNKHVKLFQGPLVENSDIIQLFESLSIRSNGSPGRTEDDRHSEGDMSISTPHIDIGVELKPADSLNQPESSVRTELAGVIPHKASARLEADDLKLKFKDGSSDVKKHLQNKPQTLFQDLQKDEPLFLELSWGLNSAVPASWSSLISSLDSSPDIMQVDYHSRRVSSFGIGIAGIGMIAAGQGVPPCTDGIFSCNDPEEGGLMIAKEIAEPWID